MAKLNKQILVWAALALFLITWAGMMAPCCADGDDPPSLPGDPVDLPPGCRSLEPTAGMLGDFWMILMAMAFQLAL